MICNRNPVARRATCLTPILIVAGVWCLPAPAWAQSPDDAPDVRRDDEGGERSPRDGRRRQGDPRETLDKLQKLRVAMYEQLGMSERQRRDAEGLFTAHFESAAERYAEDVRKQQDELHTRAEEIRGQMEQAAERGDAEAVKRLRKAHAELYRNAFRGDLEATGELLTDLRERLDETQQTRFDALVRKLGLSFATREALAVGPISERLRSPDFGLSDEQRARIDEISKDALDQLADPELDPETQREILIQLRDDILAELTEEQHRKLEEDMKRYRERMRQRDEALETLRKQKEKAKADTEKPADAGEDEPPSPEID